MKKDYEQIKNILQQEGFSEEQADKIIQGSKELDEGKKIPAEEVYKSLLGKKTVTHA